MLSTVLNGHTVPDHLPSLIGLAHTLNVQGSLKGGRAISRRFEVGAATFHPLPLTVLDPVHPRWLL